MHKLSRTKIMLFLIGALLTASAPVGGAATDAPTKNSPIKIDINTSLDLNTEQLAHARFPIIRSSGFTTIYDGTVWSWVEKEKGKLDYRDVDFLCSQAHANGIKIFLKIGARPPQWWWHENESEIPRFNDGAPLFDPHKSPGGLADLSYASRREMRDYANFLKEFIARMERQPFASSIVGYNVLENELGFSYRTIKGGRTALFSDYSPPMRDYFREYLKRFYGNDLRRLNENAGTSYKTFQEIELPQPRDDLRAAETRPIWLRFMEARKLAQLEFFNSAIRAAKTVTRKLIAGSEQATASAPAYSTNYAEMASSWDKKYFIRGDYPKYYLDTEAHLSPVNIYAENPALINNVFSLAKQYKKDLMVGEFNGFFRKYQKPIPEASRATYKYGWGGVIPVEPLTVYKHLWSLFDVETSFVHRLMYFVDGTHQPAAPLSLRLNTLKQIAKPFDVVLNKQPAQVLVDFTFEDVNAAPVAFHQNIDHYGKMLASLGISYSFGNSRDLSAAALDKTPVVIVPSDSVLDNQSLATYARRGGNVIVFCNAWTQSFASLKREESWMQKNLGRTELRREGTINLTMNQGGLKKGEKFAVKRYTRFPALPRRAQVLASDAEGFAVIVRVGKILICGVDPAELATLQTLPENFRLLRALLAASNVKSFVEKPDPYISIMPLTNGYYAYAPTNFAPANYELALPVRGAWREYRLTTHDQDGVENVGAWMKLAAKKEIKSNLLAGSNLVVEWR